MIIKQLKLHNFGVYSGSNVFRFRGNRPIVLIGGMNGRGKTTFLNAVLLALYGSNSFAYTESNYKSYGQYLKSFVNLSDGTANTSVTLKFTIGSGSSETYTIQRSWAGDRQRVAEHIQVWKNDQPDDFLTENWALFIENLIPSGLSSFFFFDGEKIAELAVEETSEQMKESIKMLLGISVIDSLQSDLARVSGRAEKQHHDTAEIVNINHLRQEKNELSELLSSAQNELDTLKLEKIRKGQLLETKRLDYSAKGGDIYAQKQQLYTKRTGIVSKIESLEDRLVIDASSELPLSLVRNLLQSIQKKAVSEHEQKILVNTLGKLESLFNQYKHVDVEERDTISKFIEYVRSTAEPSSENLFENLSDASLSRLKLLLDSQLEENRKDICQRQNELASLNNQLDQLDNYLSVEIDETAINKLYRQIKELEQELIAIEVRIQGKEEECRSLNSRVIQANSVFKKSLDEYIRKVEFNDDSERILKYTHMASEILNKYTILLQQKKVSTVAETMTECYKSLANKTSLVDRIEMDPVTLDLKYISPEGESVDRATLSAGEKQLMVISLLWALARCSKKKLPVIIDTPLSRLDSAHRNSVIRTYFPQASEQTIILSTDTEIDQNYYELMKPNISDEFTLVYDDTSKSTTIRHGYFPEVVE